MSLLREIQDAAVSSEVELSVLLRKCTVLAARLGNDEFKHWVSSELNGYKEVDELPEYRIITVTSKGHFSGPFQTGLRNADIPLLCVPKNFREGLSTYYMLEPTATMESLVAKSDGNGTLSQPWNPDLVAHVGQEMYEGMNCLQAWKVIPVTAFVSALDTIRNRILTFVLEIESEEPEAGEAAINSEPVPQETVTKIFINNIQGDVQNIASDSRDFSQKADMEKEIPAVFLELIEALKTISDEELRRKTINCVEDMRDTHGTEGFKEKYLTFMSIFSDHVGVLGPVVASFLPVLASL
ncbi:hypothetical protein [Kiloniella sp.]|uniref:AbiTii domain-containing protein n=1 Tax=Kiloniella sp. TaxID=1938587 RepID=UPI003A90C831